MLKIDHRAFDQAVDALLYAAQSAKDQAGLKVMADTPRLSRPHDLPDDKPPSADWQRIRAIALGAIVALVNGAAHPDDEVHLSGFGEAVD